MHREKLLLVLLPLFRSGMYQAHSEVEDWPQMQGKHKDAFQVHGRFDRDGHPSILQPMLVQTMLKCDMVVSSN